MADHGHPPRPAGPRDPAGESSAGQRWAWAAGAGVLVLVLAGLVGAQLDLDGDRLATVDELGAGTSPWDGDTDGDELIDGFETERFLDPLDPDTDGDTVTDRDEIEQDTNPRRADSDHDGLDDAREHELATDPRTSDTDNDAVPDPREVAVGLDPLAPDTDADRVDDGEEIPLGADPWSNDTDEDGWTDRWEQLRGPQDCDGDGYDRIADADDDGDRLLDPREDESWRCQADVDADGIPDGDEAARPCVNATDCDVDGLRDHEELGTAFDRLDPDTFDAGLLDGVTKAFEDAGQPPSGDEDHDGIPDKWEDAEGLIDWQAYDPAPGQRDLLVEFVRVEGPDSAEHGPGSMRPAYANVERFFEASGDVEMDWTETTVRLDEERRPPLIPSARESYYREVLQRAEASANPYVTTVVMNPQHDQRTVQHQGVAPIRGMLAAVDYGAHTEITFEHERGTLRISPFVESLVAADRIDLLQRSSVTDGGTMADGRMFLESPDWRLTWRPFWFAQPPVQRFEDGTEIAYQRGATTLDHAELADTIAHELGHTLGLCHTNLPDCRANLSIEDRDVVGVSTMDERRRHDDLTFLDSEWDRLRDYLACPPQRSIALLAEGADRSTVIDAKYEITLENVLDVDSRECQDRDPVAGDLAPDPDPVRYDPDHGLTRDDLQQDASVYRAEAGDEVPPEPIGDADGSLAYAAGSLLASAAAVVAIARWR